ncbi:DNA breaking-rejoining enzymes super family [Candidatus Termititenax aidoneus]|uniref:DNA breaking-rejoining enzymes super family n=1 Tax=Termititenax aidoneus TaxID=2218524 RepID=A0A388TDR7_TERA1|nr:DNA breaking-rejoining enzymes super family [Candidatus Termititenax aidoneus]
MLKPAVSRGQVEQIIDDIKANPDAKQDTIYYIALLYYSGLRATEAIEYSGGDTITGKGGHERHIYGAEFVKQYEKYKTGSTNRRALCNRIKRASKRVLGFSVSPHQLRRSRATDLYQKTGDGDIKKIQILLGHNSPATTFRYILFSDTDTEASYRKHFMR